MKKIVAVGLILVMCFLCFVGCEGVVPSKQRIKQDVMSEYFHNNESGKYRNIEFGEVTRGNKEDGKYYAKIYVTYEWYFERDEYTISDYPDGWRDAEKYLNVEYKHYDTDGWVLIDVNDSDLDTWDAYHWVLG